MWSTIAIGSKVLTASADRTIKVWDKATGACLHTLTSHTDVVRSLAPAARKGLQKKRFLCIAPFALFGLVTRQTSSSLFLAAFQCYARFQLPHWLSLSSKGKYQSAVQLYRYVPSFERNCGEVTLFLFGDGFCLLLVAVFTAWSLLFYFFILQ